MTEPAEAAVGRLHAEHAPAVEDDVPAAASVPAAPAPVAPPTGLAARLGAAPWEHGFFQALRRLEALHRDRPRLGRSVRPAQDALRLAQEPAVTFAPSTLAAWEDGKPGELGEADRPPRLVQFFFGLFGPDGPLPMHLTEYARDRRRNARDPTFQRFADLFHHRALSLFFRAWAESRPTVSFDRPEDDRFAGYVASLVGLHAASLRDRDAMPDLSKLHFAGHLANQTRHAEGLGAILSAFFTVPVRIECFVGTWLPLPGGDLTRVGDTPRTAALGQSTVLGARVWSRQAKFRVVCGPLGFADYTRLLPGGSSFGRLIAIVRNHSGDTLMWDVNLILRRDEVPPLALGKQGKLGWTTWLSPRQKPTDAADLFLDASADGMARTKMRTETPASRKDAA